MKKWLIFVGVLAFGINMNTVVAKDMSLWDIGEELIDYEDKIYNDCVSSGIMFTQDELNIIYRVNNRTDNENACKKYEESKINDWKFTIKYEDGILFYKSFLSDNKNDYGESLYSSLNDLDWKWLETLNNVLKENDYVDFSQDLLYIGSEKLSRYDNNFGIIIQPTNFVVYEGGGNVEVDPIIPDPIPLPTTRSGIIMSRYMEFLAVRISGKEVRMYETTSDAVKIKLNLINFPGVEYDKKIYRLDGEEKVLLELIDEEKLIFLDKNLKSETSYSYLYGEDKYDVKTLKEPEVLDNVGNDEKEKDNNSDDVKKDDVKEEVPENPKTGASLSIILVVLLVSISYLLVHFSKKKAKFYKI